MKNWIECVPNFSEGQDRSSLDCLQRAIELKDVLVLDRHSDVDHHRSVFTLAGPAASITQAVLAAARIAVDRIDLSRHRGAHPRVGAVDVVPLVPLEGTGHQACIATATEIANRLWTELEIPVYFYGAAARCRDRRKLEVVRKHGFENLALLASNGTLAPDVGGPFLHPTAGACCVGVRDFMIAFNVLLAARDARSAKRIARRVRESSGGLPGVKALGLYLASRGMAQISMNVTRLDQTPLHIAFEAVREEAARVGLRVVGTELVGLAPHYALKAAAEAGVDVPSLHSDAVIENRLKKALQGHARRPGDPSMKPCPPTGRV